MLVVWVGDKVGYRGVDCCISCKLDCKLSLSLCREEGSTSVIVGKEDEPLSNKEKDESLEVDCWFGVD